MREKIEGRAANAVLIDVKVMPCGFRWRQRQAIEELPCVDESVRLCRVGFRALAADDAEFDAERCQPLVGIVGAKRQPVLGARGEHAIGLADPARDEVVDHHAEISVGAADRDRRRAAGCASRIEACDKPLRRGFLVAGRAVDLAGEIEARELQAFERGAELARIDVVVFDRIAGTENRGALKAGHGVDEGGLHVLRQRR